MSYQVEFSNSAKKDLRKINKTALSKIKLVFASELADQPFKGSVLTGNTEIRAWKMRMNKVDYRIAYWIDEHSQTVNVILIKSRENFYKELEKRI